MRAWCRGTRVLRFSAMYTYSAYLSWIHPLACIIFLIPSQILSTYEAVALKDTSIKTAEDAAMVEKAHADIIAKLAGRSG